jgi:hypothetical protein
MTLKSLYKSASSMPLSRPRQTHATSEIQLMRYRSSISDQQRNTTCCAAFIVLAMSNTFNNQS